MGWIPHGSAKTTHAVRAATGAMAGGAVLVVKVAQPTRTLPSERSRRSGNRAMSRQDADDSGGHPKPQRPAGGGCTSRAQGAMQGILELMKKEKRGSPVQSFFKWGQEGIVRPRPRASPAGHEKVALVLSSLGRKGRASTEGR